MLPAFSSQRTEKDSWNIINILAREKNYYLTAYRKRRKAQLSQYFFPFDIRQLYQISKQTKRVTALQSVKDDP